MAIVFVSPKRKQILFFSMIAGLFLLGLIILLLFVFLVKPKPVPEERVFKKPNIKINFVVLDSDELKNLIPLDPIEYQFRYIAITELGKEVFGKISAISEEIAREKLKQDKLVIVELEKEELGRENPFNIYYQAPVVKPKTK